MKKKLMLCLVAVCTMLSACGADPSSAENLQGTQDAQGTQEAQGTGENTANEDSGSAPEDGGNAGPGAELSEDLYSFQISYDGTVYQFPMSYQSFLELGWVDDNEGKYTTLEPGATAGTVCSRNGISVDVEIENPSTETIDFSEGQVSEFTFYGYTMREMENSPYSDIEVILPKNIKVYESTYEDIIAAYGEPTSELETSSTVSMRYKLEEDYKEVYLFFNKDSGVLECAGITCLQNNDSTSGSQEADAVDAEGYTFPTELSDDLYSFQVSINGTICQLPVPYQRFRELGWVAYDEDELTTLTMGCSTLTLCRQNDVPLDIEIENPTEETINVVDGQVGRIAFLGYLMRDDEDSAYNDMEIIFPKNIKVYEATVEDIIAAYGEPTSIKEGYPQTTLTYTLEDYYKEIVFKVTNENGVLENFEISYMN